MEHRLRCLQRKNNGSLTNPYLVVRFVQLLYFLKRIPCSSEKGSISTTTKFFTGKLLFSKDAAFFLLTQIQLQ